MAVLEARKTERDGDGDGGGCLMSREANCKVEDPKGCVIVAIGCLIWYKGRIFKVFGVGNYKP